MGEVIATVVSGAAGGAGVSAAALARSAGPAVCADRGAPSGRAEILTVLPPALTSC